jgi:hypothetical protein
MIGVNFDGNFMITAIFSWPPGRHERTPRIGQLSTGP